MNTLLSNKALNQWNLFWVISIPMSIIIFIAMQQHDMTDPHAVSEMIGISVRWAVPFIFIVTAASAVQILFPNTFTRWWLRNRKYIGLCFAVAMAWQGSFIFIMSTTFRDYYFQDVYLLRNEIEGSIGYIFLTTMVVTSFKSGSRYLTPQQWKLAHKTAVYFLWAYAYTVYWWAMFYYSKPENGGVDPGAIDYVYYWAGFLAFALRIAAWGKKRQKRITEKTNPLLLMTGGAITIFGMIVASTGTYWTESVNSYLMSPSWSVELELWLPYWPFEPFFCFFIIGFGVMLMTPMKSALLTK